MNHAEIKLLIKYLEDNREHLTNLQKEFILSVRNQYKLTGLVTPGQVESLATMKEKVIASANVAIPEPEMGSSLYSQLQEFSYIGY